MPSMPRDEGSAAFIPADGMGELSIVEEANAVASALAAFSRRGRPDDHSVQRPVAGTCHELNLAIASSFLKRTASFDRFPHADRNPILAAAKGTVTYAGTGATARWWISTTATGWSRATPI